MRGEIDETVFKLTQLQNEDLVNIILDYQLNTPVSYTHLTLPTNREV